MVNEREPGLSLPDKDIPQPVFLPPENFSHGLLEAVIPELGEPVKGKVRDSWVITQDGERQRVMVTTDRQSAFDRVVCTVPGKGQVLNLLSAYWFEETADIIPSHVIAVPHPNVTIAKEAKNTLPVEVIIRGYLAKSSTDTSLYRNYFDSENKERRVYGIQFPEGLTANQKLPDGPVITPTTKAEQGEHDQMLTDEQAAERVDTLLGDGVWEQVKHATHLLFTRASVLSKERGLILADTKYEFGVDADGQLMIIDEMHTPDSSRFWLADTYEERLAAKDDPDSFDKEILRRWLAEQGFKGNGAIPVIDPEIIAKMAEAYTVPYAMLAGQELPAQVQESIQDSVRAYRLGEREVFGGK
jgi:phosphoribosylaminoimidazole-succinocarboxamide synthase